MNHALRQLRDFFNDAPELLDHPLDLDCNHPWPAAAEEAQGQTATSPTNCFNQHPPAPFEATAAAPTSTFSTNQHHQQAVVLPSPAAAGEGPGERACPATTLAGNPCRTRVPHGATLCRFHDPDLAEAHRHASRLGGIRTSMAVRQRRLEAARRAEFEITNASLFSSFGVQVALDALFRLELTGQLSNQRTRNLLRILATASRHAGKAPHLGHDPGTFGDLVEGLNWELPAALDRAEHRDLDREHQAIRNRVAEQEELAMVLGRFPVLDKRPVTSRKLDNPLAHAKNSYEYERLVS